MDARNVTLVLAQIDTILILNVILWGSYSAALTAYYANRRRPGVAVPPDARAEASGGTRIAVSSFG
jgi:hypothetical protein